MILVIQNSLPHYRRDFFNKLSTLDEVIVVHSGPTCIKRNEKFREHTLRTIKIGPFIWQYGLTKFIKSSKPSAIIASADIRNIHSIIAMLLFDKKIHWIWWGLDRGASYWAFKIKCWIASRNNPIIFYNRKILDFFLSHGVKNKRLFVANNTFHVDRSKSYAGYIPKNIFLNVGSLDARKENDHLIRVFHKVYQQTSSDIYLYLIGDGVERNKLEVLVTQLSLKDRVFLIGKIEDLDVLEAYYSRAIASVSYGQAGLAVLQSMAFGVPFITKLNAISGGEKYNIVDGFNGLFCLDDFDSLEQVMMKLIANPAYAKYLGENAFSYYRNVASMTQMIEGFQTALDSR